MEKLKEALQHAFQNIKDTFLEYFQLKLLESRRRLQWEMRMDVDEETSVRSQDALPEDLQDMESPAVIIGFDVVSLYPNLEVSEVCRVIKESVQKSKIRWSNVDMLEAVRFLALNWTEEECRKSDGGGWEEDRRSGGGVEEDRRRIGGVQEE